MSNQAAQAPPGARASIRWDYFIETIHARHNELLVDRLKAIGAESWELVFINMPMANEYQCIFRRPVE